MKPRIPILILGCIALFIIALIAVKASPLQALQDLIMGSLGKPRSITGTLKETTPLLLAGIAVFIALRAGLFNIGVEGQFLIGAMFAAMVALAIPNALGVFLACIVGALAGAAWSLPAGLIKAYRGGHEVITTIMLNALALKLTQWACAGPLKDPNDQSPTTRTLDAAARFPNLFQADKLIVNSSLVLAILGVAALAWWLKKTVRGYEWSAVGQNPTAAKFAGIEIAQVTVMSMAVSGAIGGLAGALQVLAFEGRFYANFSPGYGFDALGVALMAGVTAWALIPAALVFGILHQGSVMLSISGVPKSITTILLGLLIIIFAAIRYQKKEAA